MKQEGAAVLDGSNSFILIGVICAIPVVGIIAALIAARVRSNRPDS
jgi:hypothetical protein